jgi:flagellar biosynthesis protein FlhF
MESQTFRAATMLQALQEVQKELGSDAIVVSMREQPATVWRKASCEIVATRPAAKLAKPTKPAPVDPARVAVPVVQKAYTHQNSGVSHEAPARQAAPAASPSKVAVPFTPRSLSQLATSSEAITQKVSGWVAPEIDAKPALEAPAMHPPLRAGAPVASPGTPEAGTGSPLKPAAPAKSDRLAPEDIKGQAAPLLPLDRLREKLVKQGLNDSLIERLMRTCTNALPAFRLEDEAYLTQYIKKLLLAGLKPPTQNLAQGRHVVCLVGMGGTGKTSTAAKLAAEFSLQQGKRVVWIEANTVRTGAIAEARAITDSFGVELHLAYAPDDLIAALEKTIDADLVLVDTAACNPRREESMVELGALLTSLPGRTTFLVAPASTKETDLAQALAAFGPFYLDGLIFTKMDETGTYGSVYNLCWQSKLPIAFFTEGAGAIEGLKAGSGQALVDALFGEGA